MDVTTLKKRQANRRGIFDGAKCPNCKGTARYRHSGACVWCASKDCSKTVKAKSATQNALTSDIYAPKENRPKIYSTHTVGVQTRAAAPQSFKSHAGRAKNTFKPKEPVTPSKELPAFPVPLPSEKAAADYSDVPSRDGQEQFRERIVAAYGGCAVTGCADDAALEAAHIVPYVNKKSNIVGNGLCLRADIHKLFDRNLITISEDGTITVSPRIKSAGYRSLDGRAIHAPANQADKPDPTLLAWRLRVLGRDYPQVGGRSLDRHRLSCRASENCSKHNPTT